jgi:hypothetical protein
MADRSTDPWYATAAYLYVLQLDSLALAWEYLRRHPDYRRDWLRPRHRDATAHHWGLRFLEDPRLDARDAQPVWLSGQNRSAQLCPDADPPPGAASFDVWRMPGRKQLVHDGRLLRLATCWPGNCQRWALAPNLEAGMAYAYAIPAAPCARCHSFSDELVTRVRASNAATQPRPSPTTLLELHTVQALDATLAGASLREVAEGLFGAEAAASDWHADSRLRSKVRRLVRRAHALMHGDYRRLAQLDPPAQGRCELTAKRP